MKRLIGISLCVCIISTVASGITVRGIYLEFVTIGSPGNPGDTRTDFPDKANPYGCGAVNYMYQIGKYEITNGQWDTFVSLAGAPIGNPSEAYDESAYWPGDNVSANEVSWYESLQFCNYLTSGDKSQGAYLFSGDNSNPGDYLGIDRAAAIATYGTIYVIPTEDEWYKTAYYTGSGYSTFANGLDTIPAADNGWNYTGGPYYEMWDVGSGTEEQNGTFDIMGNVYEWNEEEICSYRGVRGGCYYDSHVDLRSSDRSECNPITAPYVEYHAFGFRIVSLTEEPFYELTVITTPEEKNINTTIPLSGTYVLSGWVDLSAESFSNCPDVYAFDHWEGDVADPNSPNTTMYMDSVKTVTAVFVDVRQCGDECHPNNLFGDFNNDCIINLLDFSQFALNWMVCTKPECD